MNNSAKSNRIIKNAAILYIRMILVLGLSLYTSRVVLSELGVIDFGVYNAVAGVATLFIFFNSSLINASQRFISYELGKCDVQGACNVFNLNILLYSIICLALFCVLETIGVWMVNFQMVIPEDRLFAANWIYQCSVITCILTVMQVPFTSSIIAEERMNVYAYLGVFDVLAKLIVILMLSYSTFDKLILYGLLMLLVQIVINAVYVIYCRLKFAECRFKFYWNKDKAREMFSFISYNTYGCFAWSVAYQGSAILLNIFFGPVVNAARGVALQVNGSLNNFLNGIFVAVKPQMIKSYVSGEHGYLRQLFMLSSKYSIFLFLLLAFPVVCNIDYILSVWLKEIPEFADTFTCLIIVDSLILTQLQAIGIVVNATGDVKNMQFYGRTITLLTLPVIYVLYRMNIVESPNYVFVALVIGELLYWIYCLWDMNRKLDMGYKEYIKNVLCRSLFLIAIMSTFNGGLNIFLEDKTFASFIISVAMNVVAILFFGYLFFVNNEEKIMVKGYIRRKRDI